MSIIIITKLCPISYMEITSLYMHIGFRGNKMLTDLVVGYFCPPDTVHTSARELIILT